jgi:hypothetical protein
MYMLTFSIALYYLLEEEILIRFYYKFVKILNIIIIKILNIIIIKILNIIIIKILNIIIIKILFSVILLFNVKLNHIIN